jgi:ribose transport system permease protein
MADATIDDRLSRITLLTRIWPWLFLIVLLVFFEAWAQIEVGRSFIFSAYNVQAILLAASAPLLLALGQTFVIITAGIDLSVGFVMGLAAVTVAQVALMAGNTPLALALAGIVTVMVCLFSGWVSGTLVARLNVPAFIGTLGMYGISRGAGFLTAGSGMTVSIDSPILAWLGNGWTPIIVTAILLLILHFVLSQTRFGQHTYAIGGSLQSAARAGINVKRHLTSVYMLSGFCAAVGGIIYTARYSAGAANAGESMLLDSIAAVVIGGASLFGGTGTVIGTLIGSLIIAVIQFGLIFIDIDAFWQFIAVGAVIILSVLIDQYKDRLARSA